MTCLEVRTAATCSSLATLPEHRAPGLAPPALAIVSHSCLDATLLYAHSSCPARHPLATLMPEPTCNMPAGTPAAMRCHLHPTSPHLSSTSTGSSRWLRGVAASGAPSRPGASSSRTEQHRQGCGRNAVVCSATTDILTSLAAGDSLPLHSRRILVTAPRQYASKLCGKILAAGGRPLWLPTIQIAELREQQAQQRYCCENKRRRIPSKNGIAAVLGALEGWLGSLDAAVRHIQESGIKCWALGADAEALLQAGLAEVHRPKEPSTQGLVRELVERGEAEGRRVLCPVPLVIPPLVEPEVVPRFLASLRESGAEAVRVDAYETGVGCQPSSCSAEWELLMEGEIHAIAFSSTAEAVRAHSVVLAAHGPYTAVGAANVLGIPVTCVSKDSSTFDGLVAALSKDLDSRQR